MKRSSKTRAIPSNGLNKESKKAQITSRKNRQKNTRDQSYRNLQDTDVTANQGYDLFCSMNNTAFQYFIGELIPDTFQMSITLNSTPTDYNISLLPFTDKSAAQSVDGNNNVSVAIPFSASPATNDGAESFTGTTTLEFDISQMVLNSFRKGNMLALDGTTGSYMSSGSNTTSISTNTGYAFEAWVNMSSSTTDIPIICGHFPSSSSGNTSFLSYNASDKKLSFRVGGNFYESDEIDNLVDGNWHHVAASVVSQVISFYVDGVLVGTQNCSASSYSANQIVIAGGATGGTSNFNGDITDVRMWSVSRSQSEIQQYMNVDMETLSAFPSGLFQLWKFDGNPDSPVNKINTSNVGTFEGTASVSQPPKPTKYYMVNWLSTTNVFQTPSTVINDNNDPDLVTAFNTALTTKINTALLPIGNYVQPNFNNYGGLFRPSNLYFITSSTGYTTSGLEYQMTMYGMYSNRLIPSVDAKTTVQNNQTYLGILDDATTNVTASLRDYVVLNTRKTIIAKAAKAAASDFSLDLQSNGTYKLYLNKNRVPIGPWYLFSSLRKYVVQFGTNGVNHDTSYEQPLAYIEDLKSTRYGDPQPRENGIQDIQIKRRSGVTAKSQPNWAFTFFITAVAAVVLFLIAAPVAPIAALIVFVVFIIIGYTWHRRVAKRAQDRVGSRKNANAHFTVKYMLYDYSQVVQGFLGQPDFDMTFQNADGENKIVYNTATDLNLTLTNNYSSIDCYTAASGPDGVASTITISLPLFLQKNADDMQQNFSGNSNWSCTVDNTGNAPKLVLTCINDFTWATGSSNALSFKFSNITCTYLNGVTMSGTVRTNIANTSESANIISAQRFNYIGVAEKQYSLAWAPLNQGKFATYTPLQSSPYVISSTDSNPTILAKGTIVVGSGNNAQTLAFNLTYQNDLVTNKGVRAAMISTSGGSGRNYYGQYVIPGGAITQSAAAYLNNTGTNAGIEFTVSSASS
ncbi:MAG: LamG domain-containing protein [Bacteroidota bacterium]